MAERAVIALGSNLSEPLERLRSAREELVRLGPVEAASSIYKTAPVGGPPGQPDYLNAVVVLAVAEPLSDPRVLLEALLEIERDQGRRRRLRWEARTLDLDLLDAGGRVVAEPELILPHPRMMERAFVLAPLCEALPAWRHPVSGLGACEALKALPRAGVVRTGLGWGPG